MNTYESSNKKARCSRETFNGAFCSWDFSKLNIRLQDMDWYYGNITKEQAEVILLKCNKDSFLIRENSVQNEYTVGLYNSSDKIVFHCPIEPGEKGLKFANEDEEYPNLISLVFQSPMLRSYSPPNRFEMLQFQEKKTSSNHKRPLPIPHPSPSSTPIPTSHCLPTTPPNRLKANGPQSPPLDPYTRLRSSSLQNSLRTPKAASNDSTKPEISKQPGKSAILVKGTSVPNSPVSKRPLPKVNNIENSPNNDRCVQWAKFQKLNASESELHFAIRNNDLDKVRCLVNGPNARQLVKQLDGLHQTPLLVAVALERLDMIKAMLKVLTKEDFEEKFEDGTTIGHSAVMNCTPNSIVTLLKVNYNLSNLGDNDNNLLLHYLSQYYSFTDLEPFQILLGKGTNINAKNNNGETCLHKLILNPYESVLDIANFLINKGVDINAINNQKETALHYCVYKKKEKLLQLLVKKGADTKKKNKDGMTPLDVAISSNYSQIQSYLKSENCGSVSMNKLDSPKFSYIRQENIPANFQIQLASKPKRRNTIEFKRSSAEAKRSGFIEMENAKKQALCVSQDMKLEGKEVPRFSDNSKAPYSARNKVIEEMIDTEEQYLNYLKTFNKLYVVPLKQSCILSEQEFDTLFSNLEDLIQFSANLLEILLSNVNRKEMKDNIFYSLADLFIKLEFYFRVFLKFCGNQEFALQQIDLLQQNNQFVTFTKNIFSKPEFKQLHLDSFLMKPIQRLTKYPLLLEEILKQTREKDNPTEHKLLQEAILNFKDLITDVNTEIGNKKKLVELKNATGSNLDWLLKSRSLIRDGNLKILTSKDKLKEMHLYLLSDFLLVVSKATNQKKIDVKGIISLTVGLVKPIKHLNGFPHAFEVVDVAQKKQFTFIVDSYLEQMLWLEDINKQTNFSFSFNQK